MTFDFLYDSNALGMLLSVCTPPNTKDEERRKYALQH